MRISRSSRLLYSRHSTWPRFGPTNRLFSSACVVPVGAGEIPRLLASAAAAPCGVKNEGRWKWSAHQEVRRPVPTPPKPESRFALEILACSVRSEVRARIKVGRRLDGALDGALGGVASEGESVICAGTTEALMCSRSGDPTGEVEAETARLRSTASGDPLGRSVPLAVSRS